MLAHRLAREDIARQVDLVDDPPMADTHLHLHMYGTVRPFTPPRGSAPASQDIEAVRKSDSIFFEHEG